jgi:hypothetical protein
LLATHVFSSRIFLRIIISPLLACIPARFRTPETAFHLCIPSVKNCYVTMEGNTPYQNHSIFHSTSDIIMLTLHLPRCTENQVQVQVQVLSRVYRPNSVPASFEKMTQRPSRLQQPRCNPSVNCGNVPDNLNPFRNRP